MTSSNTNRYLLHRDCARSSRDILLDVEMLDTKEPGFENTRGTLDRWLETAEARFETFRNSYRGLTGIDLATTPNPQVDHQA